jgi:phage baseplate assembly protein W
MPILQEKRRINPLDINKRVNIGVALPLDETNMFKGTESVKEQSKSNLLNLLFTHPGERINLPSFGIGLKELIFEQRIDLENLKKYIQSQVNRFIPNIHLTRVTSTLSEDEHTLSISLYFMYMLDRTSDSIQLNFNY